MSEINTKLQSDVPLLEVQSLTKQVADLNLDANEPLVIVNDIHFAIKSGEIIAIVGPSGSGKSTLLGLLAGLDTPTKGKVLVDGQDIFRLNEDGRALLRAQKMGFVFQSFQLLPAFTTLENVMLPLEIIGVADAEPIARRVLERVGLGRRLQHYPQQLSGGEQQRVAIARAFAPSPRILLADEPTGNLDRHTGQQIIELLFELNQEKGTTLILVTHDMSLAKKCHRLLQLEGGQLQTPATA
ncbi:MAG: ABC transporter ATP-binding protein [Gammaproteobacteria bacterium]|nr:ABC transporter ATP-binding protein [Gammaproteobacteria bacterium]